MIDTLEKLSGRQVAWAIVALLVVTLFIPEAGWWIFAVVLLSVWVSASVVKAMVD